MQLLFRVADESGYLSRFGVVVLESGRQSQDRSEEDQLQNEGERHRYRGRQTKQTSFRCRRQCSDSERQKVGERCDRDRGAHFFVDHS